MHYRLSIAVVGLYGVAVAATVRCAATSKATSASDVAAASGKDVLGAVNADIAAQAKNAALANSLTTSNNAFVAAAQAAAGSANTTAIRGVLLATGSPSNATAVQAAANDLAAQTVEVDKALLTIANPNSKPNEVKAAAAQALADELAEGDERTTLAQASSDQNAANTFLSQVNQLGPSVVLNGFTQIAQGKGNAQQLALAITNAREQVIVPANCGLIQSGSGTNPCTTRQAIDPALFKSTAGATKQAGKKAASRRRLLAAESQG